MLVFSQTLSVMIQCFPLTTNHIYRYASLSTKMMHTRGTRRMLLKIEQRRRLEMPRGSQSHPLRCASRLHQEKGHVQQRHGFINATLSSPTGIARRPPRCCCLTQVGARRMLLKWLNYNVLIHIDCNIDLHANRSLLSYMEF